MAGSQTLTTNILINAKTGSGFAQVGSTLEQLGNIVNGISQQLIGFGRDSLNVYKDYEANMKEAEVALATSYGRGTAKLTNVMKGLDKAATEWSASTIFHTDDVSNAIAEMAHAGWDYEKILDGMPAAMQLAQAGSLDLSEAVDYIVKSTNAAKVPFEDLGSFIDHWAYSANTSATNIGEMGEAFLRMGQTMKFAGGTDQVMVMLATLANAGTVGSDAGTLLRNSMLRLVAPTQKAQDVMADLGATSEEVAELVDDESLALANARLEAHGFSAYDEKGNLKDMLTVFQDLAEAVDGMSDQEMDETLSAIFPTRSITGALALLDAARENYGGLFDELQNGSAEGYGEYASNQMMDTLSGSMEIFASKVERLQQVTGKELSGDVRSFLESFGGMIDGIAEMDEGTFSALVGGFEVIAAAGPGLLLAGGAIKGIGAVIGTFSGSTITAAAAGIALAAIAITAFGRALDKYDEYQFEQRFGDMSLDSSKISAYANSIKTEYEEANKEVLALQENLAAALSSYETDTSTLASKLTTAVVTKMELSQADQASLRLLGSNIRQRVLDAVEANWSETEIGTRSMFEAAGMEESSVLGDIMTIVEAGFAADTARAEELSQQFRDALASGLEDGIFTSKELEAVQKSLDELDEMIALQAEKAAYIEKQSLLRKQRALGLESIQENAEIMRGPMDTILEAEQNEYLGLRFIIEKAYDNADEEGNVRWTDREGVEHTSKVEEKEAILAGYDAAYEQSKYVSTAKGSAGIYELYKAGIQGSDLSGAFDALSEVAQAAVANGYVSYDDLANYEDLYADDTKYLGRALEMAVDSMGGLEALQGYADVLQGTEPELAAQYQELAAMYRLANVIPSASSPEWDGADRYTLEGTPIERQPALGLLDQDRYADTTGGVVAVPQQPQVTDFAPTSYGGLGAFGGVELGETTVSVVPEIDQEAAMDLPPADMPVNPVVGEIDVDSLAHIDAVPIDIQPHVEGANVQEELLSQGAEILVDAEANTESLHATIQAENFQELMAYVNGDASDLQGKITDQDGRVVTTFVNGNTSAAQEAINKLGGQTVYVNIVGRKLFASGGRATEASIFGEAGPEWAIPEEHSQRTADLLDSARAASGFTWPDLLSRVGGLNANPNNIPTTLVYSPTVNAADATGVEAVLREDKDRFERWFRERRFFDSVEVYA